MELKAVTEAINGLKGHFLQVKTDLEAVIKQRDDEIKQLGVAREETGTQIKTLNDRAEEIAKELKGVQARLDEFEAKGKRMGFGPDSEVRKSLGAMFVESEQYKGFNAAGDNRSGAVQVKSFYRKDAQPGTLTGESLGNVPGYLYSPERLAGIIAGPDRTTRVRDLIPVLTTGLGAIEFVRETGFVNSAATVPEYRDSYGEGQDPTPLAKPKSGLAYDIESISMKTIAHWLPVTRQILADAPGLRAYIDNRLIYGLKLVEDQQILYGSGTSNDLQGILTEPNIQTYDWSSGKTGDTKVDAIRRAMTLARVAEYPVTGVVLHPNDWEDIELLKGNDAHYIWVRVPDGGQPRVWRVPVVDTTAIQEGHFLTGAFDMGTALWDREQASIRVSDSHENFFTKNLLAILAEERLTQTIYRPEAFVYGTFDAAPNGGNGEGEGEGEG